MNYNFGMQYILLKKISHADCLLRLILKRVELLEEDVIAALQSENEVRHIMCTITQELLVAVHDIKTKFVKHSYITRKKH